MCLILFAINNHPKYKLILAANRDEYFKRPTIPADYWEGQPDVLGGRDMVSGGTWLGITKKGRFIAITNYRDPENMKTEAPSRGELSKAFLLSDESVQSFINRLSSHASEYNGFNLLLSDNGFETITHYSNVSEETTTVYKGLHGLSNHILDTPWPKVTKGKQYLNHLLSEEQINPESVKEILLDNGQAADDILPATGIPIDLERKLSAMFIRIPGYGTRCSTVILLDKNNKMQFVEWTYNEEKEITSKKNHILLLND